MELLNQKGKPLCLAYAFAMVLGCYPEDLIEQLGVDSLEAWWNAEGDAHRRGYHIQEMVDYCLARDISVTRIEAIPVLRNPSNPEVWKLYQSKDALIDRMNVYLRANSGVLVGKTKEGAGHAVAWCHSEQLCFDPNGVKYSKDDFAIREFYILKSLQ